MEALRQKRGFTMIEILVSIAILVTFTAVTMVAFRNVYRHSGERIAVQEIADALRESRNKSIGSIQEMVFGVRIATSSVTRFVGSTYSATSTSNTVYYFEGGATATGTLVRNATSIVFSRLLGTPSATGTILVRDIDNQSTTTITIVQTGLIEY